MIRNLLVAAALAVAVIALVLALAPRDSAPGVPAGATAPKPPIVIGADTMADVLAALDLKPVEIVDE